MTRSSHRHPASSDAPEKSGNRRAWSRRTLVATLCAATFLVLPGVVPAAQAAGWSWGAGFHIGGLSFRIGYQGHHYRDVYFRTHSHIRSRARCTDRCFMRDRHYHHHSSCPVVVGYFRSHGYSSHALLDHYGPARYRNRGHYRGERYDRYDRRYDRYDRYDRRHRRDRYRDRRHRYDRHDHWRYERDRYHRDTCPWH